MNTELYNKLLTAANILLQMENDNKTSANTKNIPKKQFYQPIAPPTLLSFATFTSFLFTISILTYIILGQSELIIPFFIMIPITLTFIVVEIVSENKEKNKYRSNSLNNTDDIYNQHLAFLPIEYRNLHAVLYMMNLVINNNADTLIQVLTKYQEHLRDLDTNIPMENFPMKREDVLKNEQKALMSLLTDKKAP